MVDTETKIFPEPLTETSSRLYCDACGFYPIQPVHGHFVCPVCQHQTRCCEGAPLED